MHKLKVILFIVLYLLTSIGVSINVHYCLGRVTSVHVFATKGHCPCGEFMKEHSCCDDHTVVWQLTDSQQAAPVVQIPALCGVLFACYELLVVPPQPQLQIAPLPPPEEPPPIRQPRWLLYRSLITYG